MKEGYKLTELGEIPEDWQLKTFGDVMTGFSSGQTPSRAIPEYYKGDIRWITSGELNYNVISDTIEKITPEAVKRTNLKILPKGTFLIAITGLEAEGTRGSCGIVGEEATTNQSCMALYPKKELDNDYLRHFYVKYGNWLAFKYCQGTKQQSYTGKIARILPIILPPTKEEQIAIAKALSDLDALIFSFEKLVKKKKNILRATIQLLLTGEKRLSGFDKKWSTRKLSSLGKTFGGLSGKVKKDFTDGKLPYIPFMNVMSNPIIDIDYFDYVNVQANESQNKVQKGDLLFNGSSETPEEVGMCSVLLNNIPNLYLNSFCFGFRLHKTEKANPLFISYLFRSVVGRQLIYSLAQGATRYNLSKNNFMKLEIPYPEPEEQTEIANVLSDMNNEISALERKLQKFTELKQGMMQSLLTGKKRLNKPKP